MTSRAKGACAVRALAADPGRVPRPAIPARPTRILVRRRLSNRASAILAGLREIHLRSQEFGAIYSSEGRAHFARPTGGVDARSPNLAPGLCRASCGAERQHDWCLRREPP